MYLDPTLTAHSIDRTTRLVVKPHDIVAGRTRPHEYILCSSAQKSLLWVEFQVLALEGLDVKLPHLAIEASSGACDLQRSPQAES